MTRGLILSPSAGRKCSSSASERTTDRFLANSRWPATAAGTGPKVQSDHCLAMRALLRREELFNRRKWYDEAPLAVRKFVSCTRVHPAAVRILRARVGW